MELQLKMSHTGPDGGLHYWLFDGSEPVAYAKIYEATTESGTRLELCDIETREGYRNRGFATELLDALARGYGVEAVCHSGSYTEDGFNYIARKLKRVGEPEPWARYRSMGFVADWATLSPCYS